MKNITKKLKGKKVLSMLLALIMVLSVASPALSPIMGIVAKAADENTVELAFDNLFIFEQWANSEWSGRLPGEVTGGYSESIQNGTVTLTNDVEGRTDFSTGFNMSKCSGYYTIPVEGSTKYNFSFNISAVKAGTQTAATNYQYESYVFYFDKEQQYISLNNKVNVNSWEFTTPANAAYIQVRFDSDTYNVTSTFSNIRICKDGTYVGSSSPVRKAYTKGSGNYGTLPEPSRDGYVFGGWFTADGVEVTANTEIGSVSRTVFARWDLNVSSISVKEKPAKTEYSKGEHINATGLVLNAVAGSTTHEISSGFTCEPEYLNELGTQTITVTYGGKTTTFDVVVKDSVQKNILVDDAARAATVTTRQDGDKTYTVYTFSGYNKAFNYYKLTYKTSSYMKGILTFNDNTKEEFYLEPSDNGSFNSYINDYFVVKSNTLTCTGIKSLEFAYLDKNFGDFELTSVKTQSITRVDKKQAFSNDQFTIEINYEWGGTLSYVEDIQNQPQAIANASGTEIELGEGADLNLINTYDKGRYVQAAYYGTRDQNEYKSGTYLGDDKWPYNPVQGGNQKNDGQTGYDAASKVVDYKAIYDTETNLISEVYVKTQPLDWAKSKENITPSYMETRYVFEHGMIKVYCRFVDFSGYKGAKEERQEIPAFYPIEPLNTFVYYEGGDAWSSSNQKKTITTDGTVTKTADDLDFDNDISKPKDFLNVNENWAAFVNDKNYGIGIYSSRADGFSVGVFRPKDDTKSIDADPSDDDPSSYITPFATYKMESFKAEETAYYITTGSAEEIRSDFEKVANPNYGKKSGKGTIAVPETIYMTPSTGASTTAQYYVNNTIDSTTYSFGLDVDNDVTLGKLHFYIPGAYDFKFSVSNITDTSDDIVVSASGIPVEDLSMRDDLVYPPDENGYFQFDAIVLSSTKGITAGNTATAEWKFTVTMEDGTEQIHYAYTTLYAPYIYPYGATVKVQGDASSDVFSQTISWVSGVHSIKESTYTSQSDEGHGVRYRPNFRTSAPSDDSYGLLAFLSKGNYAYIGTQKIESSTKGTAGDMYAVYATQDTSTNYFYAGQISTINDRGASRWFETNPTIGIYSFDYYAMTKNPSSGYLSGELYSSAVGNITIDTSRYTNLNQIPNLGVGLLVTDNEGGRSASWYIADFSDSYSYGKQTNYWQGNANDSKNRYPVYGTILGGEYNNATNFDNSLGSYANTGLKYAGSWNRAIKSGSTATYSIKTYFGAKNKYSTHALAFAYVDLNASQVNKSNLRTLVLQASAIDETMGYTSTSWNTFKSALQAAAKELGNPTDGDVATVTTNLKNAINGLQTEVTVYENKSTDDTAKATEKVNVARVDDNYNVTIDTAAKFSPSVPARVGYEIASWNSRALGTGTDYGKGEITVPFNSTIYAQWKPLQYKVTYNPNGGTMGTTSTTYTIEDTFALEGATKTGYTLTGWTVTSADNSASWSGTLDAGEAISGKYGNVTLTAEWTPNKYTVTFDGNGGTPASTTKTVTYNAAYGDLPTVTRNGYSFGGWYNGSTPVAATDTVSIASNHTLTAKWTAEEYTITYVTDGGSLSANAPTGYDIETTVTIPSATKSGYIFEGWTVSGGNGWTATVNAGDKVSGAYGDVTLTAKWKADTYTITFNGNGGTGSMDPQTANYGSAATLSANAFTKTGYDFKGWSTTLNGSVVYGNGASVTITEPLDQNTLTLYAVWEEKTYKVSLDANGGTGGTTVDAAYDSTLDIQDPTWEYGTFEGWSVNEDTNPYNTDAYYDKDATIYVKDLVGNAVDGEIQLYAVWKLKNNVVKDDTIVADFSQPVKFNPYEMGDHEVLMEHATKFCGNKYSIALSATAGTYGTFSLDGESVTYKPTKIMLGADETNITITLDYGDDSKQTFESKITVAPATNMYYEETFADPMKATTDSSTLVNWMVKGSSVYQLHDFEDDIYGYDKSYTDTPADFSDGTYFKTDIYSANDTANNQYKRSETAVFEFKGTGFDLISACGTTTGVQAVKISKNGNNIKNYVIDTYLADESLMTAGEDGKDGNLIRQVPILAYRATGADAYDTYTVEITAVYLSSAGAIKGNPGLTFSNAFASDGTKLDITSSAATESVKEELEALGLGDMCDNLEMRWMDENSVLNGGLGAEKNSVFGGFVQSFFSGTTQTTKTALTSYIDGLRVYNNGGKDYYKASEQNPTYYNIVSDIGKGGNFVGIDSSNYSLVFGSNFNYAEYLNSTNPKNEIYLAEGQALAFKFSAEHAETIASVMLGMRAVKGSVTTEIKSTNAGTETITPTVSSATEMYYDISSVAYVSEQTGEVTVIIANPDDGDNTTNNILAVNNLKLVNGWLESSGENGNKEVLGGSSAAIGGTAANPTPVVPEATQGDAGNVEDVPEVNDDTTTEAPEVETETEEGTTEDSIISGISSMIPGMPSSIASLLETLFSLLAQLLSSFGF